MYSIFLRLLAKYGVNTADVCKATGISQSTLSNWKKRDNILSPALLQKIADYFGVSIDYMMGKETEKDVNRQVKQNIKKVYSVVDHANSMTPHFNISKELVAKVNGVKKIKNPSQQSSKPIVAVETVEFLPDCSEHEVVNVDDDSVNNHTTYTFPEQDAVKITDEAKEIAVDFMNAPEDVKKSVRTLLKYYKLDL